MVDVFIAYTRKDAGLNSSLCERLEDFELAAFDGLYDDDAWSKRVGAAISDCVVVVVFWSPAHAATAREICAAAEAADRPLVVAYEAGTLDPDEPYLSTDRVYAYDADAADGLALLAEAIETSFQAGPAARPRPQIVVSNEEDEERPAQVTFRARKGAWNAPYWIENARAARAAGAPLRKRPYEPIEANRRDDAAMAVGRIVRVAGARVFGRVQVGVQVQAHGAVAFASGAFSTAIAAPGIATADTVIGGGAGYGGGSRGAGADGGHDAHAQGDDAPPAVWSDGVWGEGRIHRIIVEGNQRIEPATVTSYLQVRPGDAFDAERIDLSLKTLFATGLFADVQIEQHGGDLVVLVIENPIINRVIFEGLTSLEEDHFEEAVQARPRSVFTSARAQADVQGIIEVYRRSGRFAAQVTPQVRELDQNRVDLIFEVDEGPVTGVRDVNFLGNEVFSHRTLRDAIVTTESHLWNLFQNNDHYDPDRLEYDREQLRRFYNDRGYADFRVVSAVAELTPDQKDFYITFTVDEGIKYAFGDIRVQTQLDRLSPNLLLAVVPIRRGEVFRGDQIEGAIDAMTYVAGTVGYANIDIIPNVERDAANHVVNITFEVNEGPRVFIERIDIVGNNRTVDRVIRREMRVAEGDAFNRVLLDRSRQRTQALGFFGNVQAEEAPGSLPDRSVVTMAVEEESIGELAFGVGFSSVNFLFDVSVTERNLRGRGQFLRLCASTSSQRQQIDLRFIESRFMGRDLAAGVYLYSLCIDFLDQSSFENQSTGAGLPASFPLSENTSLGLTYTLVQDSTEMASYLVNIDPSDTGANLVDQCSPLNPSRALLCDQEADFLTSVVGYTFNWDGRNTPENPTLGFDFQVAQDIAGVDGEVNYIRTELEGGWYLWPNGRLIARGNVGCIFGWIGDDVRINDRFFKGGASFRGFDVAGLGPRQGLWVDDVRDIHGDGVFI